MAGILGLFGMALMGIGGLVNLVGGIMVLIVAFKESVIWGLASFFVPLVIFYFVFTHWEDSKKGFLISVAGFGSMIIGGVVMTVGAMIASPA